MTNEERQIVRNVAAICFSYINQSNSFDKQSNAAKAGELDNHPLVRVIAKEIEGRGLK